MGKETRKDEVKPRETGLPDPAQGSASHPGWIQYGVLMKPSLNDTLICNSSCTNISTKFLFTALKCGLKEKLNNKRKKGKKWRILSEN